MRGPKIICAECNQEMHPEKNGVNLDCFTKEGIPYYKVQADRWQCPTCGIKAYVGFGKPVEPHEDLYNSWESDYVVTLR